ncbi:MAG TPA: class I poly(R)-hydroxyalkanoic acid synthase [Rhodospirillaceae bacterium]|nr:class I poly(R)-hydroxyalkanoic acid synthase [Rhodospirillaceae bacterium]
MSRPHPKDEPENTVKLPDFFALSEALVDAYGRALPLFENGMKQYGKALDAKSVDPLNISKTYMDMIQRTMSDPQKFWELQNTFWNDWANLLQHSTLKFLGQESEDTIAPAEGDRRFRAEEWQKSALFDFIKQSYLLTCRWMQNTVREAEGLSDQERKKLDFYTQLYANAISPTNFAMTNPEVIKETLKTGGDNLVRGLKNLIDDLERGKGELKISTTDYDAFELGRNIATTPGRVIFQNDMMQLIQYDPAGEKVFKRPLLVVPPWINKYYILDLRADNSLIKWLVEQGHTVFAVSWVNPDAKMAQKRFEDYMDDGILASLTQIEKITGEPDCNVIGYCLGGTLLAITLAYLADKKQSDKIASATFLTTLLDFDNAGDMKLFMDDEQLDLLDREMAEKGILESKQLQRTFSLLRANDLIWSFVINNYLMGKEPFPFDLLYWNDDSTNMPAAMHSFYLRKLYRDNLLVKPGGISMNKTPIDIGKIKTPAYFLSTREDHIAPWKATFAGTKLLGGKCTFTLAASGHIAGVVNPPAKKKYCYWSSSAAPDDPENWQSKAKEHKGSWWPHWQQWITDYTGGKVAARKPAKGIEAAPGSYVRVKSV